MDGTRAKAEIWSDMADFETKWAAVGEAATAMQAAIGEGQAAIGPNMGPLGNACKDCHDSYRVPE
jgi:cytochrome c556